MKGIILCGGYATRLQPLTTNQPKHLLPVGVKPMIDHLFADLVKLPIDHFYLVTNDKFAQNFENWVSEGPWKDKVTVVNDGTTCNEDRLGAVGDMLYPVKKFDIQDDLFVVCADNLTDFNFQAMIDKFNDTKKPINGLFDVGDIEIAKKVGIVSVTPENKFLTFVEKPEEPESTLGSIGLYILPQNHLDILQECVDNDRADNSGFLVEALIKRDDVYGVVHKGFWFDIGTPETYEQAQKFFNADD